MLEIFTHPQGGEEWFKCKLGIPSASKFHLILAKGKGKSRKNYMLKLAAETLTKTKRDTYQDADMKRGIEQEPAAREEYEFITGNSVDQIGFAIRGRTGASPDGLVGAEGGIEIKAVIPETQIETVKSGRMPLKHVAQTQGDMLVFDCQWWDYVSYSPLIKNKNFIFIKRQYRDEEYIANLQKELIRFINELDEIVKKMQ